jgi:hypothetical protein
MDGNEPHKTRYPESDIAEVHGETLPEFDAHVKSDIVM